MIDGLTSCTNSPSKSKWIGNTKCLSMFFWCNNTQKKMWFAKIQWWLSIEFCREPFLLPKKYMGKTPCFRARNPIWKWHLKETPQKNTVTETIKKLFFLMASWAEQPTTLGSQSGANVYQLSGAPICASLGWHHPVDANCSVVNSIPSYEHQLRKWCFWNFTLPFSFILLWNANSLVSIQYFVWVGDPQKNNMRISNVDVFTGSDTLIWNRNHMAFRCIAGRLKSGRLGWWCVAQP